MSKEDLIETTGVIVEAFKNATFLVKIADMNASIICYVSGKMRKNNIKLLPGDKVQLEMTPYDLTKGRIVYRLG